jgi:molybdenum cofactor cytidylyltransferase
MPSEDRLGVIILAAGSARRLGKDKATLPWGCATLLEHVVSQFPAERVARCVVVANPGNQAGVRKAIPASCDVAVNPDPHAEMLESVRIGVKTLSTFGGPLCIHPVDVFAVTPGLVTMLHEAWQADRERIHLPEVGGRGGHPLVLPPRFAARVLALPAGRGLNHLLKAHAADVVRHQWPDERLLADIDTPQDYARYQPPLGSTHSRRIRDSNRHDPA